MPEFKTGTNLGLAKLSVDAEDNSFLSSAYFLITDFDGSFGLGKNAITVNNPPSDLKIEAYDVAGNVLYYEKALNNDFINNTQSVLVSFHVYPQNTTGIGKLILCGTFKNKKIRYSTNININTNKLNNSKVRFYNPPTLEVTPLLTFATATNTNDINPKFATGSFYSKAIYPSVNFNIDSNTYNKNLLNYQLFDSSSTFASKLNNFYATLYINQIKNPTNGEIISANQTSSLLIKNVINTTTLQTDTPFVYKIQNKNVISEILTGSYSITYSNYDYNPNFFNTSSYLTESIGLAGQTRFKKYSVAEITYRNLYTFSGTAYRHKVYRRSLNVPSDYTLILDENLSSTEIFKNNIIPLKSYQNLGNFYAQDFINKFYFTSSNSFTLLADSKYYIDGLNITGSSINDGYIITKLNTSPSFRNATYVAYDQNEYLNQSGSSYDCNYIKLLKNNDYIFSFNCNLLKKNAADIMTLSFYLTGSYITNKNEPLFNSSYGVKLADIKITDSLTNKNFINTLKFKFTPVNDLVGSLIIVPRGFDSAVVNNISIQLDQTKGFSTNSYTVRVPFNVNQPNELFDIRAELYDNNANVIYSNLRTIQNFDPSGSSSPSSGGGGSGDAVFNNTIINGTLQLNGISAAPAGGTYTTLYLSSSGAVYHS